MLRHPGVAWLRAIAWPTQPAVCDGEAFTGDGHEGIQDVFTQRQRPDSAMAVMLFDL